MKERPILFQSEMVRAILKGSKTQTRRIIKNQPRIDPQTGDRIFTYSDGREEVSPIEDWIALQIKLHSKYGKKGDRLWVKETFAVIPEEYGGGYAYRANYESFSDEDLVLKPWKPSIFMPRKASRILLEITNIRCQLLDNISEEDAKAEGIKPTFLIPELNTARILYKSLWESINGPESWKENPWVWVIEFKVLEPCR